MRTLLWLGTSIAVVSFGSFAAAAAPTFTVPSGWQRAPQPSFTVPAGALCSFTLQADTVEDQVITKVLATWPDGSPRDQVYVGAYYARFTNVETGASVTRNLSGEALVHWGQDGSADWYYAGPVGVAFFPGAPLAEGMYVLDGVFVVDYAADGTVTMPVHQGTEENLCKTLAK
jgi:hypothetical protein